MIVHMDQGIEANHPSVEAVRGIAARYGLKADPRENAGGSIRFISVHIVDQGDRKAGMLPEHVFMNLPGVLRVERVSPSRVGLHSMQIPRRIRIGDQQIGMDLPRMLIAGPCTVDQNIGQIARELANLGIRNLRGGCWKPRSEAYSYTGPGEHGVRMLFEAARDCHMNSVFTEVLDTCHIATVQRIAERIGFKGAVVYWVGARTYNPTLMQELGRRNNPVMIKNGLDGSIPAMVKKAEIMLAANWVFDDTGAPIQETTLRQGNDQIIFCSRGVQMEGCAPYRFAPYHEMIPALTSQYWPPVIVDPSHSAGTMENDLVIRNTVNALRHNPHGLMLEVYLNGKQAVCDAKQAVPLSRMPEVLALMAEYEPKHSRTPIPAGT